MGYIARVLGVLIVFLSTFMFVNIDNVKAGTIQGGPGYGYAQCSYRHSINRGGTDTTYSSVVKLVVKVWGSKSDGKNWLNWNNALSSADVQDSIAYSDNNNMFNTDVPNEYTGFGDGDTPNDNGTNVISAIYSENYNTAMGQDMGEFSCPPYACLKDDNNGYSYKWELPSKKQIRENKCRDGYIPMSKNTYNPEETQMSNTETTDGQIYYEKVEDETWAGAYDDDLESYKDQIKAWGDRSSYDNQYNDVGDPCKTISNNPWLIQLLSWLFWFIAIAGLVIFLVMSIMDFIKAVTGSDDANLKKAFKNLAIRAVVVVILFLLPALLNLIINFLNENLGKEGTYQIGSDGNLYCDVISSD